MVNGYLRLRIRVTMVMQPPDTTYRMIRHAFRLLNATERILISFRWRQFCVVNATPPVLATTVALFISSAQFDAFVLLLTGILRRSHPW